MQFDRLRLRGFKSFVDPTELVIAEGLTGVVGPNGCGKSNLLEALRWVMGENRARAMRGEGMDDVIFAGTDGRPARGSASVDLVLDNRARLAPAAFNAADRIEVSRRITRDLGSAYIVNGRTVRARDVQMLFADASTGAHSPALVRQGQISELINARPKARRRVLEEAAGISGLYQRRHEAELKLSAAEQNLGRVDDLLEGLDAQIRALSRQAGQARRYRELADELRRAEAALLWLRWRAADAGLAEAGAALEAGLRIAAGAEATAQAAMREREAAEEALPPLREEAQIAQAVLQRLGHEREGLDREAAQAAAEIARLETERARIDEDLARERQLDRDAADSDSALADEAARLEAAEAGHPERLAAAAHRVRTDAAALEEREAALDRLSGAAAAAAAEAAATERRAAEARETARKAEDALADDRAAQETQRAAAEQAEAEAAVTAEALAEAERAATAAGTALARAEAAAGRSRAAEVEGAAELSAAEGRHGTIAAALAAVETLIARDANGADDVTRLIDRLSVAPGYEAALAAALGDGLEAPAEAPGDGDAGWTAPGASALAAGSLPAGATPLAPHIEAPTLLAARLAATGLVDDAVTGARLQPSLAPGQRLVSLDGAMWRWDGLRLGPGGAAGEAAARLERRNRRSALAAEAAETAETLAQARAAQDAAKAAAVEAIEADRASRAALRTAEQERTRAERAHAAAETARDTARARVAALAETLDRRQAELSDAAEALTEAERAAAGVGDPAALQSELEAERARVAEARSDLLAARGEHEALTRATAGRQRRLDTIERERAGWRKRLESAGGRIAAVEARGQAAADALEAARAAPATIADRRTRLAEAIATAERRARTADDQLVAAETALRVAEGKARDAATAASGAREERARLTERQSAAAEACASAAETLRSALGTEPQAVPEALALDTAALSDPAAAEATVGRLQRSRDALGAVNLRAEEDLAEVEAERTRLAAEKDDLAAAIAKLRAGIQALNREGRERLLAAFDAVNARFAELFRHLFGGGEARLVMVEADDPLDAGLEILCQPPGKKLSTLSLLSGGEQTLTALSLIFAVFLCNPAPICVLDEVDAPLDDANVGRFCGLLDEMVRRTRTRFLIITHHAITMGRMDRLFGVTMAERGVSQLVSVDLARAAEMAGA